MYRVIKYNLNFTEVEECSLAEIASHLADALNRNMGFCVVRIKSKVHPMDTRYWVVRVHTSKK